ncbi:MAG: hypothetical protein FIB07_13840 [Candidatus Methanoperedens sp.]|nr:hypothetical protein [Candidatus Methanoperedens sp.]
MVEDTGKIISNGFETYTKNFNICIPFILNFFISFLLVVLLAGFGFAGIFGSSLSNIQNAKSPEEFVSILLPLIGQHIVEIAIIVMIIVLILFFIQAYFISGAIGMAIQATESGKSNLSIMRDAGKKNVINMFLAEILFSLLSLVGIIFIVPGAMNIDSSKMPTSENIGAFALLAGGFLLWAAYLIILSIVLAVFRFALVADNLGPLESLTASLSFFKKNTVEVILLFIFIFVIALVFIIIDQIIGQIPIISTIWPYISFLISLAIISPLTTIWWVRLYMSRTNRKLYFDDLLVHPNDIIKSN